MKLSDPTSFIFRGFIFTAILFILSVRSSGQGIDPGNLLFRYLTLEDGLPNNKVNAVAMDKYGFMWFGTNDGVVRYDGLNMKYYAQDHLIGNQARTSQVSVIKTDSEGHLLIGTYSLFTYNFDLDRIVQCDTSGGTERTGRVYAIEEGNDGTIWIGCEKGLFSYSCEKNILTSHPLRVEKEFTIISLLHDNGRLWFGTRNDGLFIYDISRNTFSTVPGFILSQSVKDQVNCFYKAANGLIWAGTQDNGIFRYDPSDTSLVHIFPDSSNTLSYRVRKIMNDRYGNIWIGCRLGIFFQEAGTDSMKLIKQIDPLPSTSRSNSIYDIFIDPNEIMWTGTFSFGVGYTDFRRKPFNLYNLSDEETMFFAKMINCFTDCDESNIWIGTEEGGLFFFNRHTRKFRQYKPEAGNKNSLAGVNVKTLARESNGNLWIGYYNSGLDYMDTGTGKIIHYGPDRNRQTSLSSNLIRTVILDREENLWIGTDRGVDFLKKGTKEFVHYRLNIEVLKLYRDKDDNIWAGTAGDGIYRFDPATGEFAKVYNEYFSTTIKDIYRDSKGNLWVGTNKGLYYVDLKTDSLIYTGTDQGLPANAILGILEDNSRNIWVSTGAGLVKCRGAVDNPQSFDILKFSSRDGLQGEHFREFASYKNESGEFYFGGVQGFNIFIPDSIKSNPYPPRIALTALKIFNREVVPGEKIKERIVLDKAINETGMLTLSYKHSPVSIEFAALHFSDPKSNLFRFKLVPAEEEWNYSSGIRNFAPYFNLNGGDYEFVIEAANVDGLWNPEPRTLKIKVIPPFWTTWWFFAIIIFVLSAAGMAYYFHRITLLERYNAELGRKVDERTHELKESLAQVLENQIFIEKQSEILNQQKDQLQQLNSTKDRFFSIIAHDLRGPFQSLLGISELLAEKTRNDSDPDLRFYSQTIFESSKHIHDLVENLLTWSRTQREKITYEPEELDISCIIDNTINILGSLIGQKNISVVKQLQTGKRGYADRNMIEMVMRNLVTNAIKFTHDNGQILISLSENDNALQTEVSDNGTGISPADQLKLFKIDSNLSNKGTKGEKGTGLGLIICKEFIEKNHGRIWFTSKPGEGSSFFFTIPLSQNP